MTNIQETLEQYGLPEKQAKVYLAILSLGTASITEIAKKSALKRPTVYLVIEELLKQNLLVTVPRAKKTCYKAINPEELVKTLEQKKQSLLASLPRLSALYHKSSKKPLVRFYEGKDKLFKIYSEVARAKEIWGMFSPDGFLSVFDEEVNRHFFRVINRHGGRLYDLFEDTKKARELAGAPYRKGMAEQKFLPKRFKLATDIMVFDQKVALISFENVTGVIIEDKDIAKAQKDMLEFIWNHLS